MKLIAAQIASIPGEIGKNISKHSMSLASLRAKMPTYWSFPSCPSLVMNQVWRRLWRCTRLIGALMSFRH